MQALSFYISYPFLWLFSLLPLRVLYFIADFVVYPILYHLIGYRKTVVKENILRVFPEKSAEERLKIEKGFYHYLSSLFMETIKGFTISPASLTKHLTYNNPEEIKRVFEQSKGVILTTGHIGNYEWLAIDIPNSLKIPVAVPYKKLTNPYFDKAFKTSRERGGSILFHTHRTQFFLKREKSKYILALANDQSASPDKSYWTKFFGIDTTFFVGTEYVAKQMDFAVVFLNIQATKRGHYALTFQTITENPTEEPVGAIMESHVKLLEENIRQAPEYWLWSHKRWKHKKPENFEGGFPKTSGRKRS